MQYQILPLKNRDNCFLKLLVFFNVYLHKIIEDFVIYITVGKCYSLIVNFEK